MLWPIGSAQPASITVARSQAEVSGSCRSRALTAIASSSPENEGFAMHPVTETLYLSTEIARPRGAVWAAFADTETRQQWGVPAGDGLVYDHDDFRTGGSARYRCGSPERLEFSAAMSYIRVEAESYVVHTDTVWSGEEVLGTAMITWTFSDVPAGTCVSIVDQVVSFVGQDMIEGSRNGHRIVLEQLGAFLAGPGQIGSGPRDGDSGAS